MRSTQQMSITLPLEMAKRVKQRVSNGYYASESEVTREGLRALQERENAVENWLRTEVTAIYDAYKADIRLPDEAELDWAGIYSPQDIRIFCRRPRLCGPHQDLRKWVRNVPRTPQHPRSCPTRVTHCGFERRVSVAFELSPPNCYPPHPLCRAAV
ncbi:putative transcriptional regulator, CopG/Arc/MetJ family (plasmid) [Rhizobium leguminosarum bv. trifolii WSM1325]|uniref:Putative transcriptional regulator, CopG/Arc/MetJ family n=1 Tax=Rhizobium leguminosarum bv. trifolii (strain WSM1325) TaxID=395491 RepID=C6B5G6_RHILS|nr:putative transcriptional regulator, CopG/Arc/MetJ family [Rhizobium leguminosarum bv. trifolii WSM1325]